MLSPYNPDDVRMRIRDLRKGLGWTQEELAEKTNVSVNTIAKIECGLRNPSIDLITILSQVLETTANYLVMGIPPEQDEIRDIDKTLAKIDAAISILLPLREKLLLEKERLRQQLETAP